MTEIELLEDVLINLFTKKYTKMQKLKSLAYAELNLDKAIPLFEQHQPDYIYYDFGVHRIMSCTLIKELQLNS